MHASMNLITFLCMLVIFVGCQSENGDGSEGAAEFEFLEGTTEMSVTAISWSAVNISPDYWYADDVKPTAFYKFTITMEIKEGYDKVYLVDIEYPNGNFSNIYHSQYDPSPAHVYYEDATFTHDGWYYDSEHLHEVALGDYRVWVTNIYGEVISQKFSIADINGHASQGYAYTPEENTGAIPALLTRPEVISLQVDGAGLVIQAKANDLRAKSYSVDVFNEYGEFISRSGIHDIPESDFTVRVSSDELSENATGYYSRSHAQQIAISTYHLPAEEAETESLFQAISSKHSYDTLYDLGSYESSPDIKISSSHGSDIIAGMTIEFDASKTTDDVDETEDLWFRWDFDGDGEFDTDFSHNPIVRHQYEEEGFQKVELQVVDAEGNSKKKDFTLWVHEIYGFVFNEISVEPVLPTSNDAKGVFYTTADNGRTLYSVDVDTGSVVGEFSTLNNGVDSYRWDNYVSQDGEVLYIALDNSESSSVIVALDALTLDVISRTTIDAVFNGFLVTSTGEAYVRASPGLLAFNLSDGSLINSGSEIPSRNFTLSVDERRIYLDWSANEVEYYEVSPGTGIGDYYKSTDVTDGFSTDCCSGFAGESQWLFDSKLSSNVSILIDKYGDFHFFDFSKTIDSSEIDAITFDEEQGVFFVLDQWDNKIWMINASTGELIQEVAHEVNIPYSIQMSGGRLAVIGMQYYTTYLISYVSHPCPSCGSNEAPVAEFSVSSLYIDMGESIVFSASESYDPENNTLYYQWDFNGDGQWDTEFGSSPSASHKYRIDGGYTAYLRVKDEYGNLSIASEELLVSHRMVHSMGVAGYTADKLPFPVEAVLYDEDRSLLYVSDAENGFVYFIDAHTGLVSKKFDVGLHPQKLRLNASKTKLFAIVRTHFDDVFSISQEVPVYGYLVIFDLNSQVLERYMKIMYDPFDVATVDDRFAYISTISSGIKKYSFEAGEISGDCEGFSDGSYSSLVAAEDGSAIYYKKSRDVLRRIYLADGSAHCEQSAFPPAYASLVGGADFVSTKDLTKVITFGGDGYQLDHTDQNNFLTLGRIDTRTIWDLYVEDERNVIWFLNTRKNPEYADLDDLSTIGFISENVSGEARFIVPVGDEVLILSELYSEGKTEIYRFPHPLSE